MQGSYKCGPCNPGFIGDGYAGCSPGDLCTNSSHTCHENALCIHTGAGTYTCQVTSRQAATAIIFVIIIIVDKLS